MKKFLLLILFPLLLFSCGKNNVYGTYLFQMGGDKGTHFGVQVNLIDEDVSVKDPDTGVTTVKGKKFEFGLRLSDDVVPEPPEDPEAEDIEKVFLWLVAEFLNIEKDPTAGLRGYFTIGDKEYENKGKRIYMTPLIIDSEVEIPVDVLERFIVGYISDKNIELVLPVSLEDIRQQLCWYGVLIDLNNIEEPIKDVKYLPGPQDDEERIGTHPTAAEIVEMNEKNAEDFKKANFTFRDFHNLTVELKKE